MADEGTQRRILVADDEEFTRDLLTTALRFVGHEVETAADGLEALARAATFRPDLLILDVMMPGHDGFEVCRRLRADGITAPVIFLTARDAPADKLTGFTEGADDYVTKPFSLEEVVARVRAVLHRTAAAQAATLVVSEAQAMVAGPSTNPAPTKLPTNAWVVDTGRRVTVASTTHPVAPASTERANAGVGRAVTMPVENSLVSPAAAWTETTEPARVVTTPHASALR